MLERIKKIHMVGIGGIGMSGIAGLLVTRGFEVTGSDLVNSSTVMRLRDSGVQVFEGHATSNLQDPDLVVVSSAVPDDNPELTEASRRQIPVVGRGAILAELAKEKRVVAVAGSHGKTTTTSMIAFVLKELGLDPTAVIGGVVGAFGSNARFGQGQFMVVEADESDRSFLHLTPEIGVLTNVDEEHLDAYGDMDQLEKAFGEFAARVPDSGRLVVCVDDPRLAKIARGFRSRVVTYGTDSPEASVSAERIDLDSMSSTCRLRVDVGRISGAAELCLPVPGRHNLNNALATVAVAACLDLEPTSVARVLGCFTGVERRFQRFSTSFGVDVVDDYGHHPTEIAAVIATARLSEPKRLVVLFQPHRFSRTARLLEQFGDALAQADALILSDIYPGSGAPIPGVDSVRLAASVGQHRDIPIQIADSLDQAVTHVGSHALPGDLILVLGAGSVGKLATRIVELLERRVA